jgi:hypothetical protein
MSDIYFSSNYDTNSLFLLQVPSNLLENIEKEDELIIKGTTPTILCTKDKGYELKLLETTNTLLIVQNKEDNSNNKEIILKADHSVEATSTTPRKYYIYNLLKKFCTLKYDTSTGQNNLSSFKQIYSLKNLFSLCDLPSVQFNKLILETHIFEYNENIACLFDFNCVIEIVGALLKSLSYHNKYKFNNLDEIFQLFLSTDSQFNEVINKMNYNEKRNLVEYIGDIDNNNFSIVLNIDKIKLFIAKSLFYSNKDSNNFEFKLINFVQLFNNALSLYLPIELYEIDNRNTNKYLTENDCEDNLYPGYKDFDLRFLTRQCIIYMSKSYNEPLIKWIDVSELNEKFEERINELYSIKYTWNMKELVLFLEDLEIGNLHDRILRLTRPVQEDNIFNKTKKISALYLKKNPFFNKKL